MKHRISREQLLFSLICIVFYLAHACNAFAASYLKELGLAASGIGAVMALQNILGIFSSPFLGNLSDRLGSARKGFMIALIGASFFIVFIPVVGDAWVSLFPAAALVMVGWAFFRIPANALLDTWMIRRAEQTGAFRYGSVRFWGSLSGATMCLIYAGIVRRTGTNRLVMFCYAVFALTALLLCLTVGRSLSDSGGGKKQKDRAGVKTALKSRPFVLFLLSHAAVGLAVYCTSSYLPFKLSEIGVSGDRLGMLIALRGFTEVPMLLMGGRVLKRWNARPVLLICFLAFLAEHLLCACTGSLFVIGAALTAHGLFYGMYMAAMVQYVFRMLPENIAASGQSLCTGASLVMAILGNLVCGVLVDRFGSAGFFLPAALLFALSALLFLLSGRKASAVKA